MMNRTPIPWADYTWNPTTGCTKGCEYCYARGIAKRFGQLDKRDPYLTAGAIFPGQANLALPEEGAFPWDFHPTIYPHRLDEPLKLKKPSDIFLGSMGDLFDPAFPDEFRDRVFATVAATPQHTYLLLTKQPENMRRYFTEQQPFIPREGMTTSRVMPRNLHLGVTVTDQADADERIPLLLDTPAAVRWVSVEPMLGPVDLTMLRVKSGVLVDALTGATTNVHEVPVYGRGASLGWVVVGGKTPGRPLHERQDCKPAAAGRLDRCPVTEFECPKPPYQSVGCPEFDQRPDWLRSLRDQCEAAGVFFLYKHGSTIPDLDGVRHNARPDVAR